MYFRFSDVYTEDTYVPAGGEEHIYEPEPVRDNEEGEGARSLFSPIGRCHAPQGRAAPG